VRQRPLLFAIVLVFTVLLTTRRRPLAFHSATSSFPLVINGRFALTKVTNLQGFIFSGHRQTLHAVAPGGGTGGLEQILENVKEGISGERGQAYVAAQAFLVLCVLAGGVPLFGDSLYIVAGPVAMAVGALMVAAAIYELGPALSPWIMPAETANELKTSGIFAYVRHPIYGGLLLLCFGLGVVSNSASRIVLTAVLYYILELKSELEEVNLEGKYEAYRTYKETVTSKFLPDPRSL